MTSPQAQARAQATQCCDLPPRPRPRPPRSEAFPADPVLPCQLVPGLLLADTACAASNIWLGLEINMGGFFHDVSEGREKEVGNLLTEPFKPIALRPAMAFTVKSVGRWPASVVEHWKFKKGA